MNVKAANTQAPYGRALLAIGFASLAWVASAQQPPAGRGVQPQGAMANFTGGVRSLESPDVRASRFQYDAGARSYWHSHSGVQLLLPEQGKGRVQIRGQQIQDMIVGQPIALPAGVLHWHGAAPDQGMTQIAVNVGGVTWGEAVTDEEYLGRK